MGWAQAHGSESEEKPVRVASPWEDATSPDQGEGKHEGFFRQLKPSYHRQTLFFGALSPPFICWKGNTAGHKHWGRFLEVSGRTS